MRLRDLLEELPRARLLGKGDAEIDSVAHDSRLARPGGREDKLGYYVEAEDTIASFLSAPVILWASSRPARSLAPSGRDAEESASRRISF